MKKVLAALVAIAVLVGIFFVVNRKNPSAETPAPINGIVSGNKLGAPALAGNSGDQSRISGPASNSDLPENLAARAASPQPTPAAADATPRLPPATVLDNARVAIHNYNAAFGENPTGTNPEITAALMGSNPKQINFITPESGLRVNEKGELVDGWGTPFFFHQLSGREMEIRSAGEDRKMWTFDDLVAR